MPFTTRFTSSHPLRIDNCEGWHALVQTAVRDEYDKVIRETEGAYEQIVQSSQTLLTILKKECSNINRKQHVAQVA